MNTDPIMFLDVECLGLDDDAPVWNIAAIRVAPNGRCRWIADLLVEHDADDATRRIDAMPESFRVDYQRRYVERDPAAEVMSAGDAARIIWTHATPGTLVAGSNPDFDMRHLTRMMRAVNLEPRWHYHPFDIPQMALGYATAKMGGLPAGPWKSDYLSRIIGVDPRDYARHTALGDCQWSRAMWAAMTGRAAF